MRLMHLFVLVLAVSACGLNGEDDFARRFAQAHKASDGQLVPSMPMLQVRRMAMAAQDVVDINTITPDQLFDWAEARYSQYFPSKGKTQIFSIYQFRYYKETDTYLAVESGTKVIALGRLTGGFIVELGSLAAFQSDVANFYRSLPDFYAASRFLDQAAFGPNPASVAEIKESGLNAWIEKQLLLPPSLVDWSAYNFPDARSIQDLGAYQHMAARKIMDAFVGAPDQLRLRTTWALAGFVVVSSFRVPPVGIAEYFNYLQRYAFGTHSDFLRMLIRNPSMGLFQDNIENRANCDVCQLNENFARELLQLFTVGVSQLNMDGTVIRDSQGRPKEAFSQSDVRNLTRALTGWVYDNAHVVQIANFGTNNAGYDKLMIPTRAWHDQGPKVILGSVLPAGQTAEQDLDMVVSILANHPNAGPFLSRRLIQSLVSSDPSPDYVRRISMVYENDGSGLRGNMGAVVKAILLDPDARIGDKATGSKGSIGRIKEPVLVAASVMRGLNCSKSLYKIDGYRIYGSFTQRPFEAPTVFGFTSPDYRVSPSGINAPEHKLLTAGEFAEGRLGGSAVTGWYDFNSANGRKAFQDAGCDIGEFSSKFSNVDQEFFSLLSSRYFRGAIPPMTAQLVSRAYAIASKYGGGGPSDPYRDDFMKSLFVLQIVSSSSAFGVVR